MKLTDRHIVCGALVCCWLLLTTTGVRAQSNDWLNRVVRITGSENTRYQLLRQLSDETGYLFLYDSQTLNNDAKVKIRTGEYTLRNAIYAIAGDPNLRISLIGNNHILLHTSENKPEVRIAESMARESEYFTVAGTVHDLFTKEVIPLVTVTVAEYSMGTVTNGEGRFRLSLPDSLRYSTIRISHIGYERLELEVSSWMNKQSDFMLEPLVVPLQEVVVRAINPQQTIRRMLDERKHNYFQSPAYMTAFYREGVEHKKQNVDLTEAVLKVYKQGYQRENFADQVQLMKKRRIIDRQVKDTVVTKIKSGVLSTLMLDIVKNGADFFDIDNPAKPYVYTHTDIAVVDDRLANVISFEQNKTVKDPLYRGELYIDTDNYALLEAHFEINPKYVEKATSYFVEKKSKNFKLTLRGAKYVISYKLQPHGGYFVNHVRGDLEFRVRRKRQWFSSTLNVWFEIVNCKVDRDHVEPIPRADRLSQRSVFSETSYPYDIDFWGNLNVILPEKELKELILNNLMEVTEVSGE